MHPKMAKVTGANWEKISCFLGYGNKKRWINLNNHNNSRSPQHTVSSGSVNLKIWKNTYMMNIKMYTYQVQNGRDKMLWQNRSRERKTPSRFRDIHTTFQARWDERNWHADGQQSTGAKRSRHKWQLDGNLQTSLYKTISYWEKGAGWGSSIKNWNTM